MPTANRCGNANEDILSNDLCALSYDEDYYNHEKLLYPQKRRDPSEMPRASSSTTC